MQLFSWLQLEFEEDAYFENSLKVMQFHFNKSIEQINKPVNHAEWDTNPSAVNAFYLPVKDTMGNDTSNLQF